MRTISLFIIMLSVLLATENVLGITIANMKALEMVKRSMCGCYSNYGDHESVSVCQNSFNQFEKFLFENGTTFSPLECNIKDKSLSGTATQGNLTTQGNSTFTTQGNSTTQGNFTTQGNSTTQGNFTTQGNSTTQGNTTQASEKKTQGNSTTQGTTLTTQATTSEKKNQEKAPKITTATIGTNFSTELSSVTPGIPVNESEAKTSGPKNDTTTQTPSEEKTTSTKIPVVEAAETSSYKTVFIGILCVVVILVLGFGAYSWYLGKCPCIKSSLPFSGAKSGSAANYY